MILNDTTFLNPLVVVDVGRRFNILEHHELVTVVIKSVTACTRHRSGASHSEGFASESLNF